MITFFIASSGQVMHQDNTTVKLATCSTLSKREPDLTAANSSGTFFLSTYARTIIQLSVASPTHGPVIREKDKECIKVKGRRDC